MPHKFILGQGVGYTSPKPEYFKSDADREIQIRHLEYHFSSRS